MSTSERAARVVARLGAGVTAAVALLVLSGWVLDVDALRQPIGGGNEMKANVAVSFLLAAAALWVLASPQGGPRRVARAAAVASGAIGAATLSQYAFNFDLGIDELLFVDAANGPGDPTVAPGRAAPQTGVNLLLLAAALLLLDSRRALARHVAPGLALTAGLIAYFALLRYLYGATNLAPVSHVSVLTAVGFLALTVGILTARPGWSFMSALTGPGPGSHVARRLLLSMTVALPLLGALRLQGEKSGLYDPNGGVALFVLAFLLSASVAILRVARLLNRAGEARDEAERQLKHKSLHDPLTGLANRRLFMDRLRHAFALRARRQTQLGVLFVDLDSFKQINDSRGHACGDEILREVARRLLESVRPGDTVCRHGGDEFTILCEDVADEAGAQMVAARIAEALDRPMSARVGQQVVGASVGIAVTGEALTSPEEMLRRADAAMYEAKRDRLQVARPGS
jgi:diguanylate cyclase (GGDEF)-like protein